LFRMPSRPTHATLLNGAKIANIRAAVPCLKFNLPPPNERVGVL
jgi:hypothetical protein